MISAQTKLNAVIGNPVGHSLSPNFHAAEYEKRGLNAVLLAVESQDLKKDLDALKQLGVGLIAVTLPFKESVIEWVDEIDPLAKRLGSVNTLLNVQGKWMGFNTDYHGIKTALEGVPIQGKTVLLIGAGGVAKTAAALVSDEGGNLICLNRSLDRAQQLTQTWGGRAISSPNDLKEEVHIIINATSVGLSPNDAETPLDASFLKAHQTVFDIVYNPEETRLLKEAKAAGAQTRSGKIMFEAQAKKQIDLWQNHGSIFN